ncbi:MAG: thiamine pyrophosphate-binding protein [Abditibacteriales bacterium]|nr:thiamine pyrophosphate-binding protein [Abditibacteriales bacterium]MDW8364753.1 thiamine pyrophosphate-binding protein [Abditibacteriales bacterium]
MHVAEYLFHRIRQAGVTCTFGIPGDFALPLYAAQEESGLKTIVMTHEPSVGYAADVYARFKGLGVALVTYGVGALNMVNAVAMAYAEESPVLVVSGAPEVRWQQADILFHHRVKSPDTQWHVYREVTAAQARITHAEYAVEQIDEVLDTIRRQSRPGYIEIARDLVFAPIKEPATTTRPAPPARNREALDEAVAEIVARLNNSQRPVVYAGVEIERFGLMDKLRQLVEKYNLPTATSLMGKTVLPEHHPNFIGNYFGNLGPENTRRYLENADCILALGMLLSDMDVGFEPSRIPRRRLIQATANGVSISHHHYPDINLVDVVDALLQSHAIKRFDIPTFPRPDAMPPKRAKTSALRMVTILEELNDFLTPSHVVLSDTGDCLFASVDLRAEWFIGPGYYASMGLAVPGAIGAQLARPDLRPVVLVGDGAFKMNGVELGTAKEQGLNPIVVLINNQTFATLKATDRDRAYFRVRPWDYVGIARSLGGYGEQVTTRAAFRAALHRAQACSDFYLIDAVVPEDDASPTLKRLGREYGGKIRMASRAGERP